MTKCVTLVIAFLSFFGLLKGDNISFEHELCLASIFNNEAPWLKEWIEYNRLIGVEHFLLYNNGSEDDYAEVLSPYIEAGLVTLIDWPNRPTKGEKYGWVFQTQVPAFMDAINRLNGRARWLMLCDTDEFYVTIEDMTVSEFLKSYTQYGAVVVNWDCYGTSDLWDIPEGKTMIESLTRKIKPVHHWNTVGKTIVRPECVEGPSEYGIHYFELKDGMQAVDSNGDPFVHLSSCNLDKIKINHYVTRTLNYFYNEKLRKKFAMDNKEIPYKDIKQYLYEANEIEDPTKEIFRYIPLLRNLNKFDN